MKIDKSKIEYIIGIDLGHGETSAAVCPTQWDTPVAQLESAKDLDMGGNKKVLPSAISILENGNAYIGDSAFNTEILKQAKVHVCFKKAPKDINGENEQLMIRFMNEVYKLIRENNSGLFTDDNHVVFIATPSGWNSEQQNLYLEMAKNAGMPIAGITKESRAAFVRAQKDVTSGLGRNIAKGAIVFDMGSSTLDFTYMNKSLPSLIDHGYNCGASFIEKTIFAEKKSNDEFIKLFEKKYPDLVDYLVFEARKVKEQVYFNPDLRVKKTINFDDIIEDEDLEDERFKLQFMPRELNDKLEALGYIKQIEDAMIDYKQKYIKDQKIYGVFLTGGASRMDFLKESICKSWGVDEKQIYRDQDPSLTISQGVAEVARQDLRTQGKDIEIKREIKKIISSGKIFTAFSNLFSDCLKEEITTVVKNEFETFRDEEGKMSLNDLRENIESSVNKKSSEIVANTSSFLDVAIENSTKDVKEEIKTIVAHYSSQGIEIEMPQFNINNIKINNINLEDVINSVSEGIEVQSNNWVKWALTGVGAIFGLIGIAIGYLAGNFLGGKKLTEEEKMKVALAKKLNIDERQKVYCFIEKNWEKIQESICDSIDSSLKSNKNLKSAINKECENILNDYIKILDDARILID